MSAVEYDYSRFTLTNNDRYEIAQIQREAPQLSFIDAQLLHEYRHKSYGITSLMSSELRFCEALEKQLARSKAEAAIPLRRTNDNGRGPTSFGTPSTPAADPKIKEPLPPLYISIWDFEEVPDRDWAVRDRIIRRAVTLLSGEGGVGKSILTLQLACAHVLGKDWFGSLPEPGPVIYLDAEDDRDELHFRLDTIRSRLDTTFSDLAANGLHLMPLAGEDALLGVPDRAGVVQPTPLFERLLLTATNIKPVLIVLNSAADLFAGNENNRSEVRQFIGLLRRLGIESGAGVLLTSHPSLTGISSDLDPVVFGDQAAIAGLQPAGLRHGIAGLVPTAGGGEPAMDLDVAALVAAVAPIAKTKIALCVSLDVHHSLTTRHGGALPYPIIPTSGLPSKTVMAVALPALAVAFGDSPGFGVTEDATFHAEDEAPTHIGTVGLPGEPNVTAAPVIGTFQTDSIALRLILDMSWTLRAPGSVAWISNVTW